MSREVPSHVLNALEALESASEPADLGPAYQTLLDWRRKNFSKGALGNWRLDLPSLVWIAGVTCAYLVLLNLLPDDLGDVVYGFIFVLMLASAIQAIVRHLRKRKVDQPLPLDDRIDDALGRWRHLVPAMRELPK
jgi:hypothetical protein